MVYVAFYQLINDYSSSGSGAYFLKVAYLEGTRYIILF